MTEILSKQATALFENDKQDAVGSPLNEARETQRKSFQTTLVGEDDDELNQGSFFDLDVSSFDSDSDEEDETGGECHVIRISKEEKILMRRPWSQTLLVKVLGRTVGYTYLFHCIKALWRPKAPM